MNNILIITSVASMVDQFLFPHLIHLQNKGYKVFVCCNFDHGNTCTKEKIELLKHKLKQHQIIYYNVNFDRKLKNPFNIIKCYKQIIELNQNNDIDLIHCHSPIGGVVGRLVGIKLKIPTIYTAHGFHFFKGSGFKSWIMFFPVEYILSFFTSILITINSQDFKFAKKYLNAKSTHYVPGVGIDLSKFKITPRNNDTNKVRLISVGELNDNKNHIVILRALREIKHLNFEYMICGQGINEEYIKENIKDFNLENKVFLPGFVSDVIKFYETADIYIFPSLREGLSLSLMEAMASKLPIIASDIRGNNDLVINNKGGYLIKENNLNEYALKISKLINDSEKRKKMGEFNYKMIQKFELKKILKELDKIYFEVSKGR